MSGLAVQLRNLRDAAGLTQEDLAERAGVSARTISDTERGLRQRVYADTASRLAEALGLEGPERDAFVDLARGRETRPAPRAVGKIPQPLTAMVCRARELTQIASELEPGSPRRLVTVTGLGGSGKTRLAIAAAEALLPAYQGHVWFVPLAPLQDAEQVIETIATTLGAGAAPVSVALGAAPTLMVLDAFEQVLDAADAVAELLRQAPELRVLVTSRVRVRITGELELALGSLEAADAAELFLQRAHDIAPDLHGDEEAVAEICRLTSGLPLPLELAAGHVRSLPLELLRDRLRLGLTDATQVVRDAVRWTVSSLSDTEQLVLAAAAAFPAGCRLEALGALCPATDVVGAIGALVEKNLLALEPGSSVRWRMLDAVREAAAHLHPLDTAGWGAFMGVYVGLLHEANARVGEEDAWYQTLLAEEPNIRVALLHAEQTGDAELLLKLATGMWLFWQSRGSLDEGRRWLGRALAMGPAAAVDLRMAALWGSAWLAYHQGDDDAAEHAGQLLAELSASSANDLGRRNALTINGMVAIARDRPEQAVQLLGEALQVARTLELPWISAASLLNLGLAHLADGSPEDARPALAEALQRYDEIGDTRFHARCVGYLGTAALLDGDADRARALFAQSLQAFHELSDSTGIAEALAGLASVEAVSGDATDAATLAGAAERLRQTVAARELPLERRLAERYLGAASEQVGPEAWRLAWRQGWALSAEEAAEAAVAVVQKRWAAPTGSAEG